MAQVRSVHHVGITVRNLDASLAWYTQVFGLTDTGMRAGGAGEATSQAMRVPGADLKVAFLRVADQVCIELIEYNNPQGRDYELGNNDVGAMHLCFEVEDINETYERLKSAGVSLHHEPIHLDSSAGDLAGYAFMYFRDPDGLTLELYELPRGRAF
jgi:catechol 2,3-dioxygenase-like lactoylglutathione lyase family enzyme